jgi:hypothetical protein
MYYFAGAVLAETRRRQGMRSNGFLSSHHEPLRSAVKNSHEWLCCLGQGAVAPNVAAAFQARVARDIAPFNPAGFCDPNKNNMYPFV